MRYAAPWPDFIRRSGVIRRTGAGRPAEAAISPDIQVSGARFARQNRR
jgi:hypothetical protein